MQKEKTLNDLRHKYMLKVNEVKYLYATELLDRVEDEEVLKLYDDNKEIFAKLSTLSKEEILKKTELLDAAINCLEQYLVEKEVEKETLDETIDEIINVMKEIISDKGVKVEDLIAHMLDE